MLTPVFARMRAAAPLITKKPDMPTGLMRRSVGTQKKKSSRDAGDEDIGNHLTGANKYSGKGGRLGAGDILFLVVGLAVVGYVGSMAKDEVKEVTWPKIKQKSKEVKEAVEEAGGK